MRFLKIFVVFLMNASLCFAQEIVSEEKILSGIWENGVRVIDFSSEGKIEVVSEVQDKTGEEIWIKENAVWLKNFYTLWRDGKHELYEPEKLHFLVSGDNLYIEYWENVDDEYVPRCNILDAKISETKIRENVYAYVFVEPEKTETETEIAENEVSVYKIRYWRTKMDYRSDKVYLTENIKVFRHIEINDVIYTCVVGNRSRVRNVKLQTMKKVFENTDVKRGQNFLIIGEPFMKKTDSIERRNK